MSLYCTLLVTKVVGAAFKEVEAGMVPRGEREFQGTPSPPRASLSLPDKGCQPLSLVEQPQLSLQVQRTLSRALSGKSQSVRHSLLRDRCPSEAMALGLQPSWERSHQRM